MRGPMITMLVAGVAIAGCGKSPSSPSAMSSLNVRITDSPFSDAKAVLVTFNEVAAHRSESDWTTIPFVGGGRRTCDLKKLQGAEDVLGVGSLTSGRYTQIRLVVERAELFFDTASNGPACAPTIESPAGASAQATVASGTIRLNRQFQLEAADTTTIVLDFDGDGSIVQTSAGTYVMTPIVSIVSLQ